MGMYFKPKVLAVFEALTTIPDIPKSILTLLDNQSSNLGRITRPNQFSLD
jgi:hypothetical protein